MILFIIFIQYYFIMIIDMFYYFLVNICV